MESLWRLVSLMYYPIGILYLIILLRLFVMSMKFRNSQYKTVSNNGLFKTFFNKGNYGEFLTFTKLEKMGETNILTNIYLPSKDGTTTEVDLLLVNCFGIFVFESKNYSGWIFGDEKNKMWTQSLNNGKKNKFFNPIWQNKGHISALDTYLKKQYSDMFYSFIIFSERCSLKKMTVRSENIMVIRRNELIKVMNKIKSETQPKLIQEQVQSIYETLKPCTLANDETKERHIAEIKAKHHL